MKNLFILFLVSVSLNSYSQCKYAVDSGAKKETKRTTLFTNTKNLMWGVLAKDNDAYFINLQIKRPKVFSIKAGAEITFVLSNDSTVVLINNKTKLPTTGITSEVNVELSITKEQLAILGANDVKEIKVISSDGHFEEELNDSRAEKFKTLVNCILD